MSPKRGDRVAPPALPDEFTIRFAANDAAKGWGKNSAAKPRLKHDLAWASHDGRQLEQWQYEVTSDGRIWYVVDHDVRLVWIKHAGTGHPKATDR